MDFIKILIPYSEVLNNAQIQPLAIAALLGGAKSEGTTNGVTTYSNISNNSNTYNLLTYDAISYIVSLGGNVFNYQSFIKINLSDEIPSPINIGTEESPNMINIRDYEYEDENGIMVSNTWGSWLSPNQSPIEINGEYYISGYAHYSGFKSEEKSIKHLDGRELFLLKTMGYTILNKQQFLDLLNNE